MRAKGNSGGIVINVNEGMIDAAKYLYKIDMGSTTIES